MRTSTIVIVLCIVAIATWVSIRSPYDLHTEIRQRLVEAELGSAVTIHLASRPNADAADEQSFSELMVQLRAEQPRNRWQAANALGRRADPRAVDALLEAMLDAEGTLRVCIMARALGHLQDPRALSALSEAAFDPANTDLRLCAIQSLGMIGDKSAIPTLIRALEARNMPVSAANSLARLGDELGVAPIINAANDPELQLWMITALGELGHKGATSFLEKSLPHEEPGLQRVTDEALWKISILSRTDRGTALAEVLTTEDSDQRRMWAAFRLGEPDARTHVEVLIEALSDPVQGVRGRAAAALIRIGKPAAHSIRSRATDRGASSRHYAIAILGYLGEDFDIAALNELAESTSGHVSATAAESARMLKRFARHSQS